MRCSKVSIIVPVYNAEKYLKNCVNSVLNQTYKNIEVILINDGSIDSSGKICNEYVKKDRRIKVIHQKNSGVSSTRNIGIRTATGDYIQFVDSDDYIEPNMTEKLVQYMNDNNELVICRYKSIYVREDNIITKDTICLIEGKYQKSEFIKYFGKLFKNSLINPIWNKLYDAKIIRNYNLQFIENINMGEDLLFNIQYIKACESIKIVNDSLYNYLNFNSNSLTAGYKKNLFITQQMLFSNVRRFLQENNCYIEQNKKFVELSYTDSILGCLENLVHANCSLEWIIRKEHIREIAFNDCVRKKMIYFYSGNIQKRFIGFLIEHKLIKSIYYYFKMKNCIRNNMNSLFSLLKRINNTANK